MLTTRSMTKCDFSAPARTCKRTRTNFPKFLYSNCLQQDKTSGVRLRKITKVVMKIWQTVNQQSMDMDGVPETWWCRKYGVQHWKQLTNDKTKDLKAEVINRITGTDFFATLPITQTL